MFIHSVVLLGTNTSVCIAWLERKGRHMKNLGLISQSVCVWIAGSVLTIMPLSLSLSLSAFLWLNYCQYKGSLEVCPPSALPVTRANWGIIHPGEEIGPPSLDRHSSWSLQIRWPSEWGRWHQREKKKSFRWSDSLSGSLHWGTHTRTSILRRWIWSP